MLGRSPLPPNSISFSAGRDLRVWQLPGNTRIPTQTAPACRPCREGGAGRSTSRRGGGYVLLIIINYFWALPRIPKNPPGDSDASRDSAVALSVGKASLSGLSSKMHGVPDSSQFSSVQSVSSVQLVWGGLSGRARIPRFPWNPKSQKG